MVSGTVSFTKIEMLVFTGGVPLGDLPEESEGDLVPPKRRCGVKSTHNSEPKDESAAFSTVLRLRQ